MFGWGIFERIQEAHIANNPEAAKKKEAVEQVNKIGRGICEYCGNEIVKNDSVPGSSWTWESESMVGFCDQAKARRHAPKVECSPEISSDKERSSQ